MAGLSAPKYNPGFSSDAEIIEQFTVRQIYLDLVINRVRGNVGVESIQHVLLLGARGIGKTTLVRRVAAEIRQREELDRAWYPLVFGEEIYGVTTVGEFWRETLFYLGEQTGDKRWQIAYEELEPEADDSRLAGRALAKLMDFSDEVRKRILLVVENLNLLFEEQMEENSDWELRHTLMNESRLMLLGTATTRFHEIENISGAWFELFDEIDLVPLTTAECQLMWQKVSGSTEVNEVQMQPLRILTGGNPRLVRILAEFAAQMSFQDFMGNLTQLIDEHTDYFKGQLEGLAAKERKVFVALLEIWDPVSAKEVALKARVDINKASSFLIRLVNRGAVEVVEQEGRRKFYQTTERLYNIYYLMRRRSNPASRVRAFVEFMVRYYRGKELVLSTTKIAEEIQKMGEDLRKDLFSAYREIVLHKEVNDSTKRAIVRQTCKEFWNAQDLPEDLQKLLSSYHESETKMSEPRLIEMESELRTTIEHNPEDWEAWRELGLFLHDKERYHETENAYRQAIKLNPSSEGAWALLGQLLHERLGRYDEAEKAYKEALKIKPDDVWDWVQLALLLHENIGRYAEAEKAYKKALSIKPSAWIWAQLAWLLHAKLERYEEAEEAYKSAISMECNSVRVWGMLGDLLQYKLKRYVECRTGISETIISQESV